NLSNPTITVVLIPPPKPHSHNFLRRHRSECFEATYVVSYNCQFLHDFIPVVEGLLIFICQQPADRSVGCRRFNLFRTLRLVLLPVALIIPSLSLSAQQTLVEDVLIHGNRRIPAETVRARIFTRAGDVYDPQALERDF